MKVVLQDDRVSFLRYQGRHQTSTIKGDTIAKKGNELSLQQKTAAASRGIFKTISSKEKNFISSSTLIDYDLNLILILDFEMLGVCLLLQNNRMSAVSHTNPAHSPPRLAPDDLRYHSLLVFNKINIILQDCCVFGVYHSYRDNHVLSF